MGSDDEAGGRGWIPSITVIVVGYWVLATLWIVGSDLLLSSETDTSMADSLWNMAKGVLFVTVTAGLLHPVLHRRQRALLAAQARSADLQTRLEAAQRMDAIGRLAGQVAHDFNNQLTVIGGHSRLLRAAATPEARSHLDTIDDAAERAAGLTAELLAVARRQQLHPRAVALDQLVRDQRPVFEGMLAAGADLELVLRAGSTLVEVDAARFEQALLNLMANGRDALGATGTVTLRTWVDEGTVHLAVEDTGSGMTEAERLHCFEPFFTTKAEGGGTGLGLSSTYGVVTQSGGSIVARDRPGGGTVFEIGLPASVAARPADPLSAPR